MAKKSQLDLAIENVEGQIAVLQHSLKVLLDQREAVTAKKKAATPAT